MRDTINKQDWLTAQGCLGVAWYGLRAEYEAPSEAELFRMLQGQEIGRLARQLFPDGALVCKKNGKNAAEVTQEYLQSSDAAAVFFEAAVKAGPFVAKADILRRDGSAWRLLEAKSSFSNTPSISDLVDDLAYTTMIFRRAGVKISNRLLKN